MPKWETTNAIQNLRHKTKDWFQAEKTLSRLGYGRPTVKPF